MTERPTVTVAVPVHNGEAYIAEALSSVLAQTRPADEVLVFDNASTDASTAIAQQFLPSSSIRESETHLGAVATFNPAVDQSAGDLVQQKNARPGRERTGEFESFAVEQRETS